MPQAASSPVIEDCRIYECELTAIVCSEGGSPRIENCLIEDVRWGIEAIGATPDQILTPDKRNAADGKPRYLRHPKAIYGKIMVDDGVFAALNALKRVKVAEHIFDFGEYVLRLGNYERHPVKSDSIGSNMVYFPPCHQRELNMGMPYLELLRNQYGAQVSVIDGGLYCCGMGGVMGFKKDFHNASMFKRSH